PRGLVGQQSALLSGLWSSLVVVVDSLVLGFNPCVQWAGKKRRLWRTGEMSFQVGYDSVNPGGFPFPSHLAPLSESQHNQVPPSAMGISLPKCQFLSNRAEWLTLRGQVIRETKGRAKQQQKSPNYSYHTPIPL
ncbi:hypothetical protein JOQ06_006812, partial [Pogonophryne albipinna]